MNVATLIRRLYRGLDTDPGAVQQYVQRITPVVLLDDLRTGFENDTFDHVHGIVGAAVAANAGNRSIAQLWNPPGSGVIALVYRICVGVATSGVHFITLDTTPLTATTTTRRQDLRDTALRTALRLAADNTVGSGVPATHEVVHRLYLGGNTSHTEDFEIVLPEGRGCSIMPGSDNVAVAGNWQWVEKLNPRV